MFLFIFVFDWKCVDCVCIGILEELKFFVDKVYELGFIVFFDVVYFYVSKNIFDG